MIFPSPPRSSSHTLAESLSLQVIGKEIEITGITSPQAPQKNMLIPLLETRSKNRELMESALTQGNCFLTVLPAYEALSPSLKEGATWLLTTADKIREAFISLLTHFDTYHSPFAAIPIEATEGRISKKSKDDLTAINSRIDEEVFIGPQVVMGRDTHIASGSVLLGQNYIGYGVGIGKNSLIHPQVTIHNGTRIGENAIIHSGTVLGSDGFGFEATPRGMVKIPQIGNVVLGNDVEIGSNCSVDRATLNSTRIGDRVKIDNLVQIAHNVSIGDDSIIVGQVGIAGSCVIGKRVILGGQVGIADHATIGDGVKIGLKSIVFPGRKIPDGATLRGIPAIDHIQQSRTEAALRNLSKKKRG